MIPKKADNIIFSSKNVIPEKTEKAMNFVISETRSYEYNKILKSISTQLEKISSAIPELNTTEKALNASDSQIKVALSGYDTDSIAKFKESVNSLHEIRDSIGTYGIKPGDFNALPMVDQIFLTLQMHYTLNEILLPESVLNIDGVNIEKAITDYFKSGSSKSLKDNLRSLCGKLLKEQGTLFYGVKIRKSDLNASDLREFVTYFTMDNPLKKTIKNKETGRKELDVYDWNTKKFSDKKTQLKALTNLLCVSLANNRSFEIIVPENQEPSKSGSKSGSKAKKAEPGKAEPGKAEPGKAEPGKAA